MSLIRVDNFGPSAGGTTYSARGVAKAWVNFNGTGTVAVRDSENVASITDNGTGDYTANLSSTFGGADYNFTFGGNVGDGVVISISSTQAIPTSSAIRVRSYNASWISTDGSYINISIHGDLA